MGKRYHRVLTIAGSDSSGGAGIQADLKTFSALGCYGMSVITALTAQNTTGVSSIYPIPGTFIGAQMEAVLEDMGADAIKIGMLYSKEAVIAVFKGLEKHHGKSIVLDPLLVSHDGRRLLEEEAVRHLKAMLIPLSTLVTPNLPETCSLLGQEVKGAQDMYEAARTLASWGARNVLIKGGHLNGETSSDLLYIGPENRFLHLDKRRVKTRNDHGTGCTLTSAIAAFLAKGLSLEDSVRSAKEYLTSALEHGAEYEIGKGRGPLHHFYEFW
ncbi:MAG: bifunctional hydroxymethylpyrimidine kinase/phosphomethylpyrimidine kinase [Deltaproteobacteria bacterium]|nr:bifunctional hydroxymethylpyrimidine kinase/phosphomethylpyrimidine kinase [Deltaproteobacteria bacterium]